MLSRSVRQIRCLNPLVVTSAAGSALKEEHHRDEELYSFSMGAPSSLARPPGT